MLVGAASVAVVVLSCRLASLGIDYEAVFGQEFVSHLHGSLEVSACVVAQVYYEALEAVVSQLSQRHEHLGIGVLAEVLDAYVARLLVEHIGGADALGLHLAARDGVVLHLL